MIKWRYKCGESRFRSGGGGEADMKKPSILMGPSLDIHVSYLQVIWVTPPPSGINVLVFGLEES